jgi:hypothetical protein
MSREVRDGSAVDVASHTCQLEAVRVGTSLIADVGRWLCELVYLSTSTYLLFGSGVVLFRTSEVIVRLTSVGISSASRSILLYTLKNINFLLLFLITNYFYSHLWRSIRDCPCLGSRKKIPTRDNIIRRMWTDRMSCLYEIHMKKSEIRRTIGGIDSGSTSMKTLADHLSRVIRYLMYHRQQKYLIWAIYLTDSVRYTKIYKVYISIYINRKWVIYV